MTHTTETHPPRAIARQQGFGLVELAISLTLIAVLLLGAFYIVRNIQTSTVQKEFSQSANQFMAAASKFMAHTHDILEALAQSKTVVLNLGSANEQIIRYFSKSLCLSIFHAQERKFVNNQLDGHYVQIYFEEAHMIFPPNQGNVINVYSRFAKEGAKFNIGIVYCTQSPTTVNMDLLSQTENFFIGHLASRNETDYLSAVQVAFQGCEDQIMRSRTPGFMQMLTHSHRYVVPVQMRMYDGKPRELV